MLSCVSAIMTSQSSVPECKLRHVKRHSSCAGSVLLGIYYMLCRLNPELLIATYVPGCFVIAGYDEYTSILKASTFVYVDIFIW